MKLFPLAEGLAFLNRADLWRDPSPLAGISFVSLGLKPNFPRSRRPQCTRNLLAAYVCNPG